jgi:hypothetical protein
MVLCNKAGTSLLSKRKTELQCKAQKLHLDESRSAPTKAVKIQDDARDHLFPAPPPSNKSGSVPSANSNPTAQKKPKKAKATQAAHTDTITRAVPHGPGPGAGAPTRPERLRRHGWRQLEAGAQEPSPPPRASKRSNLGGERSAAAITIPRPRRLGSPSSLRESSPPRVLSACAASVSRNPKNYQKNFPKSSFARSISIDRATYLIR